MKNPIAWLFIVSIYASALTGYIVGDKKITDALPSIQYSAQVDDSLFTNPEKLPIKK